MVGRRWARRKASAVTATEEGGHRGLGLMVDGRYWHRGGGDEKSGCWRRGGGK
ncbi:hypothetical protein B0T17DRAFT_526370 [Bombardia bombarda]|uniref:Uncharacterized protein n=1 Tax=Bombardia bombarda TaxID=252184 RepID=A0AA40C9Q9_9PEZI|nr:hypothetical protein B0T17DRAFT_526370 [Bombardia bombarda]